MRDRKRGKKITFYHIKESGEKNSPLHDEAIIWLELPQAREKMKHTSERNFIEKYIL